MTDRWQVLQGDARTLPLPDASVDAVVGTSGMRPLSGSLEA